MAILILIFYCLPTHIFVTSRPTKMVNLSKFAELDQGDSHTISNIIWSRIVCQTALDLKTAQMHITLGFFPLFWLGILFSFFFFFSQPTTNIQHPTQRKKLQSDTFFLFYRPPPTPKKRLESDSSNKRSNVYRLSTVVTVLVLVVRKHRFGTKSRFKFKSTKGPRGMLHLKKRVCRFKVFEYKGPLNQKPFNISA